MVVVSHLFLFLRKSFRGRFDLYESNLPLFGTIYFPIAPSFALLCNDVLVQHSIGNGTNIGNHDYTVESR